MVKKLFACNLPFFIPYRKNCCSCSSEVIIVMWRLALLFPVSWELLHTVGLSDGFVATWAGRHEGHFQLVFINTFVKTTRQSRQLAISHLWKQLEYLSNCFAPHKVLSKLMHEVFLQFWFFPYKYWQFWDQLFKRWIPLSTWSMSISHIRLALSKLITLSAG